MPSLRSQISAMISPLWVVFLILAQWRVSLVLGDEINGGNGDGSSQFCSIDLASFLPPPYGNLSYSSCRPVWNTFVLRVSPFSPLPLPPNTNLDSRYNGTECTN
uniref:Secreted protein n=1 Tax=Opuntia streptacantha TaxID=393608 RepID=A0A7C9E1F7_OPUST